MVPKKPTYENIKTLEKPSKISKLERLASAMGITVLSLLLFLGKNSKDAQAGQPLNKEFKIADSTSADSTETEVIKDTTITVGDYRDNINLAGDTTVKMGDSWQGHFAKTAAFANMKEKLAKNGLEWVEGSVDSMKLNIMCELPLDAINASPDEPMDSIKQKITAYYQPPSYRINTILMRISPILKYRAADDDPLLGDGNRSVVIYFLQEDIIPITVKGDKIIFRFIAKSIINPDKNESEKEYLANLNEVFKMMTLKSGYNPAIHEGTVTSFSTSASRGGFGGGYGRDKGNPLNVLTLDPKKLQEQGIKDPYLFKYGPTRNPLITIDATGDFKKTSQDTTDTGNGGNPDSTDTGGGEPTSDPRESLPENYDIIAYPNPVKQEHNQINVMAMLDEVGVHKIKVYNLLGQEIDLNLANIHNEREGNIKVIRIPSNKFENLPNGIYFLTIQDDAGKIVRTVKVMISNK